MRCARWRSTLRRLYANRESRSLRNGLVANPQLATSLFLLPLVLIKRSKGLRNGFTLIEAVVGVTIAAILSFAIYMVAGSRSMGGSEADDRAERAGQAAAVLFDIASAIAALETTNPPVSYLQTVGAYPTRLSQLTAPITTADRNSCDRVADSYTAAAIPASGPAYPGHTLGWKGPYYIVAFVLNGTTQVASGFVVQDDMIRIPANVGNNPRDNDLAGQLQIRMNNVTQLDAVALDAAVDLTISGTAGTVRYTGADPTAVEYELRVSGC